MEQEPKRRRGRPEGATLTEEIRIRIEPELLTVVDQMARLGGVTRSAFIRHAVGVYCADDKRGRPRKEPQG